MLRHYNTFNDDFHIFEKNRFFEVQKLAKKMKIEDFTKNSCPHPRIVLLEEISLQSPQTRLESTSPPLLPTCIPKFDFFETYSKKFRFLNIPWYKTKFPLLLPQMILSESMDSELSSAFSNVIWSLKLIKIRIFKVMFQNVWWFQILTKFPFLAHMGKLRLHLVGNERVRLHPVGNERVKGICSKMRSLVFLKKKLNFPSI